MRRASIPILLAVLGFLIILPVAVLAIGSFLGAPPRALHFDFSGLTLANYRAALTQDQFWHLLGATVGLAGVGTAGAVAIGAALSFLAVRTDIPGRRALEAVAVMPMFVPATGGRLRVGHPGVAAQRHHQRAAPRRRHPPRGQRL